jgi:hypothetical protein
MRFPYNVNLSFTSLLLPKRGHSPHFQAREQFGAAFAARKNKSFRFAFFLTAARAASQSPKGSKAATKFTKTSHKTKRIPQGHKHHKAYPSLLK